MNRVSSIRFSDLTALAWGSLRRNRLRSLLTIGAISLGISVMMFLISLGLGLEQLTIGAVERSAALLSLSVSTPNAELIPLTEKSVRDISKVQGVSSVFPQLTVEGEIQLGNSVGAVTIIGADPAFLEGSEDTSLSIGRPFREDDQAIMVVSNGFLKQFNLTDNRTPLVTFIMRIKGDDIPDVPEVPEVSVSGVINSDSVKVYVPRMYLESLLASAKVTQPPYSSAKVIVNNLDSVEGASDSIRALGYRVASVSDTIGQIRQVFSWVQAILASLGVIAIAVASIGMFNTLTISLLERTREIGIMKALGVKRGDIRRLFLMEAFLMGLSGGVAGVMIALVAQQITLFALGLLATLVDGEVPHLFINHFLLVGGFIFFGIMIALLTGFYPARRAMRLNPIDAIRYE